VKDLSGLLKLKRFKMSKSEVERLTNEIVEKLKANYHPQKIILFGSYADGNPREGSDIDLLIIKETDERFIDRWVRVRRILSDPTRTIGLDTIILTPSEVEIRISRGDQFIKGIINHGRYLYAA